jgi:hypothetical protein
MSTKVDLLGTGTQAISDTITSQRRVNVIYDLRADGENAPVAIIPTPGLSLYAQLPFPGIRALWQNGQYAFAIAQNGLFLIQNEGFTFLGGFGATFTPYVCEMKTNLTELVIADGVSIWTFNISNLATLITTGGTVVNGLSPLQNMLLNMWD